MPRIRSLKPEIWQSADFEALSLVGRLTFIALISNADDYGRIKTDAKHLVTSYLHGGSVAQVETQLERMEQRGMVVRYGEGCIALRNWEAHQKVPHATKSRLPEPPEGSQMSLSEIVVKSSAPPRARGQAHSSPLPSIPFPSSPLPSGGSGGDAEVERVGELVEGLQEILKRPLTARSRAIVLAWSQLERDGQAVPIAEILDLAKRALSTRLKNGNLPPNLAFVDDTVRTLARGPAAAPSRRSDRAAARDAEIRRLMGASA